MVTSRNAELFLFKVTSTGVMASVPIQEGVGCISLCLHPLPPFSRCPLFSLPSSARDCINHCCQPRMAQHCPRNTPSEWTKPQTSSHDILSAVVTQVGVKHKSDHNWGLQHVVLSLLSRKVSNRGPCKHRRHIEVLLGPSGHWQNSENS